VRKYLMPKNVRCFKWWVSISVHVYVTKSFLHNNSNCDFAQHAVIAPPNTMVDKGSMYCL
jgi:hypothetical protein